MARRETCTRKKDGRRFLIGRECCETIPEAEKVACWPHDRSSESWSPLLYPRWPVPILVCPRCHDTMRVSVKSCGQVIWCPHCRRALRVPLAPGGDALSVQSRKRWGKALAFAACLLLLLACSATIPVFMAGPFWNRETINAEMASLVPLIERPGPIGVVTGEIRSPTRSANPPMAKPGAGPRRAHHCVRPVRGMHHSRRLPGTRWSADRRRERG